jgi:hypothetical protein
MRVTNLRMVVETVPDHGAGQLVPGNTLLVSAFPVAITLNVRIRYDGVIPPDHAVEAAVETPSGSVADKAWAYTGKQQTANGEVKVSLKFTAFEAGVYTTRATVNNQDVPPKRLEIRRSAPAAR